MAQQGGEPVPWSDRRAGAVGGPALVRQDELRWLEASGVRGSVKVVRSHPTGLLLDGQPGLPGELVYVVVAQRPGYGLAWVGAVAPKLRGPTAPVLPDLGGRGRRRRRRVRGDGLRLG